MKNNAVRIISLLLALSLLLCSLAGCAKSAPEKDSLNVVATIFAPYDFARELTAEIEDVNLTLLLKPGMDAHHFEPTPQDMITVQDADLFIYVGGESDRWVDTILDSIDTRNMQLLTLMDCVELMHTDELHEQDHGDGEEHHHHSEYDEHVWTSPKNAMLIAGRIAEELALAAPEKADAIEANRLSYQKKLAALDEGFSELFAGHPEKEIIMGDRFPFLYMARDYGISYYAAFPGCAAESEPNARTMAFLIDKIKTDHIPVVFHMELSNEQVADALCEATGARKLQLHACHNITDDDFKAGESYLSLMEQNLKNLTEALK